MAIENLSRPHLPGYNVAFYVRGVQPRPLSTEEVFQKIGHLSVFYSTLDMLVGILAFGLGPEKFSRSGVTLGQRLKFLETLKETDCPHPVVLKELQLRLSELMEVADKRNRTLHDLWSFNDENLRKGILRRGRIKLDAKKLAGLVEWTTMTIEDLDTLLEEVGTAQKLAGTLAQKMGTFPLADGQACVTSKDE